MQEPDPQTYPSFAVCLAVLKQLARYGGCMRIGPLLRASALPCDDLCATLNDLAARRCIKVAWRRAPYATLPPRLCDVGRITLTRFGRSRLPVPWIWHPPRLSRRRRCPKHRPRVDRLAG